MPVSDYTPTVQDIARLLRARTRDSHGDLVRDFTDETEPSGDDVQGLIDLAVDNVSGLLGADIPTDYLDAVRSLVVYLASANVELSFWPDQASATGSMYDKLMDRYTTKLTALQEALSTGAEVPDDELPVDIFGTNWYTIGGGFPQPYWWRYTQW